MKKLSTLLLGLCFLGGTTAFGQETTQNTIKTSKTIKPFLNNIPVVYQENVKGGIHQVGALASDVNANLKEDGMLIWADAEESHYQWDNAAGEWRAVRLIREWPTDAQSIDAKDGQLFYKDSRIFEALLDNTITSGSAPLTDDTNWATMSGAEETIPTNKTLIPEAQFHEKLGSNLKVAYSLAGNEITLKDFILTVFFPAVAPSAPEITTFALDNPIEASFAYSDWIDWNTTKEIIFDYAVTNSSKNDDTDDTDFTGIELLNNGTQAILATAGNLSDVNAGASYTGQISYDIDKSAGSATDDTEITYNLRVFDGTNTITASNTDTPLTLPTVTLQAANQLTTSFLIENGATDVQVKNFPFTRGSFTPDINWKLTLNEEAEASEVYIDVSTNIGSATNIGPMSNESNQIYQPDIDATSLDNYPSTSNTNMTRTYMLRVKGDVRTDGYVDETVTVRMDGYDPISLTNVELRENNNGDLLPNRKLEYGEFSDVSIRWTVTNPGEAVDNPNDELQNDLTLKRGNTAGGYIAEGTPTQGAGTNFINVTVGDNDEGKRFSITADGDLSSPVTLYTPYINWTYRIYRGIVHEKPTICDGEPAGTLDIANSTVVKDLDNLVTEGENRLDEDWRDAGGLTFPLSGTFSSGQPNYIVFAFPSTHTVADVEYFQDPSWFDFSMGGNIKQTNFTFTTEKGYTITTPQYTVLCICNNYTGGTVQVRMDNTAE